MYCIDFHRLSAEFRLSADWARFSPAVSGAKLHLVYNPDTRRPKFAEVTAATTSPSPSRCRSKPGATYVFDLGDHDYGWWAKLDAAGCRIVSRLKVNTPLAIVAENRAPADSRCCPIASVICRRAKRARAKIRSRRVRSSGKILRIFTNDLYAATRSPNSTSAGGRSSCSSVGSSIPSKSVTSWERPRRRSHSDRDRADRLSAVARRSRPEQRAKPARLHPIGQPKSHAPPLNQPSARKCRRATTKYFAPVGASIYAKLKPDSRGSNPAMTSENFGQSMQQEPANADASTCPASLYKIVNLAASMSSAVVWSSPSASARMSR